MAKKKKEIVYIIAPGDTLTSISKRFNVKHEDIKKKNGLISSASLRAGSKISI